MLRFRDFVFSGVFAAAATCGVCGGASFAQNSTPPLSLSPSPNVGWIAYGTDFLPPASGAGPVHSDPAHPFIPDEVEYRAAQPSMKFMGASTFRVADLSNPILLPWTREALRKRNEAVLAGRPGYTRQTACWPNGVPVYLLYPVQPLFFVQTAKEIVMMTQFDHMIRHVYLNVPHSPKVQPSWHGESVGHYEGDALVVDTVGLNDQVYVDNYRTPHTDKLHIVERYHLVDEGKVLQIDLRVEDPGAFTQPWNAIQRYRRVEPGPIIEMNCAENNANYFNHETEPMPEAKRPDF